MARIFITGSADGLGHLTAKALIAQGHQVVLHARNEKRAQEALDKAPGAEATLVADLCDIEETIRLGEKVNALGTFDAVIHNAGIYHAPVSALFTVNTLAPYVLTCLIGKPERLIYLSSGMHEGGSFSTGSLKTTLERLTYSDTKLHVLMLCNAVARKWPGVYANTINPGWVPTKMGGAAATDNLEKGFQTQVWLAASSDIKAKTSGQFFYHQKQTRSNQQAGNVVLQEHLLAICQELTGISFPE